MNICESLVQKNLAPLVDNTNFYLFKRIDEKGTSYWSLRSVYYNWNAILLNPSHTFMSVRGITEIFVCMKQIKIILEDMQG